MDSAYTIFHNFNLNSNTGTIDWCFKSGLLAFTIVSGVMFGFVVGSGIFMICFGYTDKEQVTFDGGRIKKETSKKNLLKMSPKKKNRETYPKSLKE